MVNNLYRPTVLIPEVESRTQKKSEAKDSFSEDRHSRGQGPRTQAQMRSPKKKKGLRKNFSGDLQKKKKKGLHKNFPSDLHKKMFSNKFFKRSTKF